MREKFRKLNIFGSIRIKLIFLYISLVFIVMLISGTFIQMQIKNQEASIVEKELLEYFDYAKDQLFSKHMDNPTIVAEKMKTPSTDAPLAPLSGKVGIEFCILDARGYAKAPLEVEGKHFDDSIVVSAATGQAEFIPWEKDTAKIKSSNIKVWMKFAAPIYDRDEIKYIVYIAKDASEILENFTKVVNILFIAVAIAMGLAIIIGALFSSTITGPITSLTKSAREMAGGNLSQEIPVKSGDEIGQLTESFNYMAGSLAKSMNDMAIEKSRIEIILNNMTDGVLAYDSNNNLVHANDASSEMLGVIDIRKMNFSEVMKIFGLDIKNVDEFYDVIDKDNVIPINNKYISINYNPYDGEKGIMAGLVLVLQDVTKHTKLDNMRKEFVANVSHELRTPLTTIKTYTETLIDGAMDDKEIATRFLNTIESEVDRMTMLTTDLLELSRYDNKQLVMEMEEANLVSLINNSIRQNQVLLEQKNQKIIFTPHEKSMFIECDPSRIGQVLNNIISNSIKYSPENTDISIDTSTRNSNYIVKIKDKGIGIPEEDQARVFERFYRVDKDRSRLMGGTGLGLAIAKEIMDSHSGSIKAISTKGGGTTMILSFPRLD